MLFGRPLKKHVSPCINEEADIGCFSVLPDAADAIALIVDLPEFPICRKTVPQIAAYSSRPDRQIHALADCFWSVPVATFEIDRYRQMSGTDDAAQILDRKCER